MVYIFYTHTHTPLNVSEWQGRNQKLQLPLGNWEGGAQAGGRRSALHLLLHLNYAPRGYATYFLIIEKIDLPGCRHTADLYLEGHGRHREEGQREGSRLPSTHSPVVLWGFYPVHR